MKKIELFIPVNPVPKGRPRFTRTGHSYTPQKTQEFEKTVCTYYSDNCGEYFDGAIKVYLRFYMPIPKGVSKKKHLLMVHKEIKHISKPDLDNLAKSVLDSVNGIAYKDDSQITVLHIEKAYGEEPGIELKIIEDVE